MKVRREVLKAQAIMLLASTVAIVAGSATGARAADQIAIVKAPPVETGWYFNGEIDVGGRVYLQRPGSGFGRSANGTLLLPSQTESIAKFWKFGTIREGVFLDWLYLDLGTKDGRFRHQFSASDVGTDFQNYQYEFSEAGTQYLFLNWDQTQHLYSTSAKSLFSGVGSTTLTVNPAVQALLEAQSNNASANTAAGLAARQAINTIINNNATSIDRLGFERDKFGFAYRYTPTSDWDFNVSYTHEDKKGTKPGSLNYSPTPGFPSNVIGIPIPVDDTTHTPKASGEYAGVGPWGKYNVKLGYNGSIYQDNITLLTAQNPFGQVGGPAAVGGVFVGAPGMLALGMPPSNQAHAFTASGATDLPFLKSRFTTTNQITRLTQNDAFIPSTVAGNAIAGAGGPVSPLPAASLNGQVTNFLTNNVLTSALTPTLNNKFRVRYYERDNETTPLTIGTVVLADSEFHAGATPQYTSFNKTNINEELVWTPWRWFTLGAGYEFERWNRSADRFATQTNEHIGSVFAVTKLADWAQWRSSYSYGVRRYNNYTIDPSDLANINAWLNARTFDLANRNEQRARTLVDITLTDAISIQPNAGLRWDDYPDTVFNQLGLSSEHAWNVGIDTAVVASASLRLTAGYNFEQIKLSQSAAVPNAAAPATCNSAAGGTIIPTACTWFGDQTQTFHTFITSADWKAIPGKLDFRANYLASWERAANTFTPCSGNFPNCNGMQLAADQNPADYGLPWADQTVFFQRFDIVGRYHFDPDAMNFMGLKGQLTAKLRYTFERNRGSFWYSDSVNAYFATLTGNNELTGASRSTWLAYNNPNYTVQLLAASLSFRW